MIPRKLKKCDGECGQMAYIWKNQEGKKYCKDCYQKMSNGCARLAAKTKPTKKQYRIPSKSSKKAKLDLVYTTLRETYLKQNPLCKAHLPGICQSAATDIHHTKGRGEYQNDASTWIGVCRSCHDWIELHPNEAKELGLSQNRL